MRMKRLLIHAGKTKVMLFATAQKRSKNNLEFNLELEGKKIKEVDDAVLLGLRFSNNFTFDKHVDEVIKKCSIRLNGLYKVKQEVNQNQRKALVEGAIISKLKYAIDIVSSGSEKVMKKLEGMQSKCARYVLNIPRKE